MQCEALLLGHSHCVAVPVGQLCPAAALQQRYCPEGITGPVRARYTLVDRRSKKITPLAAAQQQLHLAPTAALQLQLGQWAWAPWAQGLGPKGQIILGTSIIIGTNNIGNNIIIINNDTGIINIDINNNITDININNSNNIIIVIISDNFIISNDIDNFIIIIVNNNINNVIVVNIIGNNNIRNNIITDSNNTMAINITTSNKNTTTCSFAAGGAWPEGPGVVLILPIVI